MSSRKEILNHLHDFVHGLKDMLSDFWDAATQTVKENGGKILEDAALAGVAAAETQGGTSQEKFDFAYAAVAAVLAKEGIPFAVNAVRLAIEAAVAKQRAGA